jgi:hypothetical protein
MYKIGLAYKRQEIMEANFKLDFQKRFENFESSVDLEI